MDNCWENAGGTLEARELGVTLVVAPHPDDETLGCGGAIALLSRHGRPAHVAIVSDGAHSHPSSQKFPKERLAAMREAESLTALKRLGVPPSSVTHLRLPDGDVPARGHELFDRAADRLAAVLERWRPLTVLLPWRRDPHCDHRATEELMSAAARKCHFAGRWLEYPIWLWKSSEASDAPRAGEIVARRLDIAPVLPLKRHAVQAYQSQIADLIDDDPNGFRLSAADLAHFDRPWELFFESEPTWRA